MHQVSARIGRREPRGRLLLHEIVHLVSEEHWKEVAQALAVLAAQVFNEKSRWNLVIDVRFRSFARQTSLVDQFISSWEVYQAVAYGHFSTVLLAELEDGVMASFFNADSYAEYGKEMTLWFLDRLWQEMAG